MINANDIRKGMVILFNNEPSLVISHEVTKHGRGGNHNKCKIKGLVTGKISNFDFFGADKAEDVEVTQNSVQFLYLDGDSACFMNPDTFDQITIPLENIPGEKTYLKEGVMYVAMFYQGEVISIQLPSKVTFEVIEAPDAVRGDTATNALKEVTVEGGVTFKVPLFIKRGDKIVINTETEEYSGKE